MVKKQSLFQNKLFQATLIVSMILVSSAIFISQSDNIFGNATSSSITGTIVLTDHLLNTKDYNAQIYLPGDSCTGVVNYCYTDGAITNSFCRTASLMHVLGNKYEVFIPPEQTMNTQSISCPSGKTFELSQTGTYIDASLTCKTYNSGWGVSSMDYCGVNNACGDGDDVRLITCSSTSTITKRYAYPVDSKFVARCSAGSGSFSYPSSATISDRIGVPVPITHVSVSYECPV